MLMAIKTLDILFLGLPIVAASCAPAIVSNVPKEPAPLVYQSQQSAEQQNRNYSRELADLIDLNASRLMKPFDANTPYWKI